MMTTLAEEEKVLWQEIHDTKQEREEVERAIENAQGAEKARLQDLRNKVEGRLEALYKAISKLPAPPGVGMP